MRSALPLFTTWIQRALHDPIRFCGRKRGRLLLQAVEAQCCKPGACPDCPLSPRLKNAHILLQV